MIFGYARVSTESQKLDSQIDAILAFGVEKENIYADVDSGKKTDRAQLETLLGKLRTDDEVVFFDLTRIGRNLKHLLTIMEHFSKHQIHFRDLSNPAINTRNIEEPSGKLIFVFFAALAEYFREESNRKVVAGLESARRKGRVGGRPKGISARLKRKAPIVAAMYRSKDPEYSIRQIREANEISQASVYKCLIHEGINIASEHRNKGNNNRVKNTKIRMSNASAEK